jgi:Sigma-70, region 4
VYVYIHLLDVVLGITARILPGGPCRTLIAAAARRRTHERRAGQLAVATSINEPPCLDHPLPVLHEEIARLPEKHRLALVLCDLEGKTQVQAAGELDWSERTLRRRPAKARDRLKARLTRRGLAPGDAMLGAAFLRESRALVPAAWQDSTVQAALGVLNHAIAVCTVSMAAQSLTREVLKTMLLQKLTLASAAVLGVGLMAWATTSALIARGGRAPENGGAGHPRATGHSRATTSARTGSTRCGRDVPGSRLGA